MIQGVTCHILCMCGGRVMYCIGISSKIKNNVRVDTHYLCFTHTHAHTQDQQCQGSPSQEIHLLNRRSLSPSLLSFHLSPPDSLSHHFSGLFHPHWGSNIESKPHLIRVQVGYTHQHRAVKLDSLHKTKTENSPNSPPGSTFSGSGWGLQLQHHGLNKQR